MTIKGVLFDKDGTLIDFDKTWNKVAHELALHVADGDEARSMELLEQVGFDRATGRFLAGSIWAAGNNFDLAAAWYPDLPLAEQLEKAGFFDRYVIRLSPEASVPLTDLNAVLEKFRLQGLVLGIATNDVQESAAAFVQAAGLGHLFEIIIGYDSVENPKPAGDMIGAFCEHTGLEPHEVAMVGDNTHDLETAANGSAGLKIGVLTGTGTRADLSPLADAILDSIDDLPDYFTTINGTAAA